MNSDPSKSSFDFGDPKPRSPLKKITEKNVIGRMLSRTKLGAKLSLDLDESFDMMSEFGSPEKREKKRSRDGHPLPSLPSPEKRQHRSSTPPRITGPPVAYRSPRAKHSLPPRLDSMPIPPTPPQEPALIPLPASPPKSASSFLSSNVHHGHFSESDRRSDARRAVTPDIHPPATQQVSPRRARANAHLPPRSPASPDIFTEFDRLFADFPQPPTGSHPLRSPHHLPTPALTAGTSSSYSGSSGSRPSTPLSPYPPPDPTRLESAINTLSQVVLCLQGTQADQATYAIRQQDLIAKMQSMERELVVLRAENLRLEVTVSREREERLRAEKEREDLRASMEQTSRKAEEEKVCPPQSHTNKQSKAASSLNTLQSQLQISAQNTLNLQDHLSSAQSHNAALESHTKSLEGEISRLTGAFDIVKEDYRVKEDEMRRRMEEAEFMHQALKESGARLGRELDGARKKYSELEKKGRGGYI